VRYASIFTGIGGFDIAFDRAGMTPTVQVEIDHNCQKVLAHHWPDVQKAGDVGDVSGRDLGRIDLMVGGFPCKDTSIAAPHRLGLDGDRSGQFWEFARLHAEYARLVDETGPEWTVIENPEGLLRSNDGRDMATVLHTLVELGYGVAYRVLDARHLGSPQRRRRILVVGRRGGDPGPASQVLGLAEDGAIASRVPAERSFTGPRAAQDPVGDSGAVIWRKSARPRKSAKEGGYATWLNDGEGNTLTGFDSGTTRQTHLVAQAGRLRVLTLTEWERLQGFPDDWTAGVPDGARFEQLGNAVHVGTAQWLADRLVAVHTIGASS
jgi:DNA (cytosine-5)-methyltransferase 1